ncbi:MAG: hypothetical protein EOO07_18700 [Chitinophagaceae bacterium]|nr:MAG: hypothetical protein EOO07_18700 [Chitinophagaceae bacterium]
MKKVLFIIGLSLFSVAGFVTAKNAPGAPRCATAGQGESNNGYCYNTYDGNGTVNGANCTEPAGSAVTKNCIF